MRYVAEIRDVGSELILRPTAAYLGMRRAGVDDVGDGWFLCGLFGINRLAHGETISIIQPCDMPIKGSAPVYPETRFAEGLDANPYYHG